MAGTKYPTIMNSSADRFAFTSYTMAQVDSVLNWISISFGFVSISLNSFVFITLLANRKVLLKNIFYLLVLHCSIVELLQSSVLVVWCLPSLNLFSMKNVIMLTVVKRWMVIFLRTMNILTLLNLLLFPVNEFIMVKKPIFHRYAVQRKFVLCFVALTWFVSIVIGTSDIVIRKFGSNLYKETVFVPKNISFTNFMSRNYLNSSIILRRTETGVLNKYPFIFATIIICVISMALIILSYAIVMKKIKSFQTKDELRLKCKDGNHVIIRISSNSNSKRFGHLKTVFRQKYILVIVSILFVHILFIVPYSIIQVFQYVNLSSDTLSRFQIRNCLQILMNLHSMLQPLCYFRMKELRRRAFCMKQFSVKHV